MEQLQAAWTAILQFLGTLIIPDWGGLIALLPVFVLVLILLWIGSVMRAFATAGPKQRGILRQHPVTPAGVHMPGPTYAPIFGAVGVALLFYGIVWGGPTLVLGFVALVLTLFYWLRLGMHDYEKVAGESILPVVVEHAGPPAGVHVPGPTFLPVISALSVAILFIGVVVGGWVLAASFVCLVVGLVGWLRAAGVEYRLTTEADQTGHLRNPPAPGFPTRLFQFFAVIMVAGFVVQAGILPPRSADGGTGASPAAGASAGTGGGGAASGAPATPAAPAADVTITAQDIAFTTADVTAPAGKAFTIAFQNKDPGTPHNVDIKKPDGTEAFKGTVFPGPATQVYQVPALAAGTYSFVCDVHANMTGTITVK
ncbi:MAG TPA: cupredoxin domain-containing protein [Candidatus Acidoferrum sp.]|nr:cupredoxin domain-containing protein [Candidatus Acidoferrum sp.]